MSFEKQQASFLNSMASAAAKINVGAKRALAPPSPSPSVGSTTSAVAPGGTTPRKERYNDTPKIVYSQPARTGMGETMMAKLTYAIRWLRGKDEAQTLKDVVDYLYTQNSASEEDKEALANYLRQSSSVEWVPDPDLTEQTWTTGTYRHRAAIPNVRSKDKLLAYLQKKTDAGGISVKDLKDGWPECEKAINELEAEHRLLVVRQKKDGAPRMVWLDDPSLFHEVDAEFKVLWSKVEVPAVDNIVQRLAAVGQKAASEDPRLKLLNQPKVQKKKRQTRKGGKLTNAHMEDKFKDFTSSMKKG